MIRQDRNLHRFCSEPIENIENYEEAVNDKENLWDCHHRLEIQGPFRNSRSLLKRCGMYYYVPASQLIFIKHSEHSRLHNIGTRNGLGNKSRTGQKQSDETRKKISESNKGKHNYSGTKAPHYGKKHSEETRRKISEAMKRHYNSKLNSERK